MQYPFLIKMHTQYAFIFKTNCVLIIVILMGIVNRVEPIEKDLSDITLNFYVNLQNYYAYENKSHDDTDIQNNILLFQDMNVRKLRNVKDHIRRHVQYGKNLYQMFDGDVYLFEKFEQYGFLRTPLLKDIAIFSHRMVDSHSNGKYWCAAIILESYQYGSSTLMIYQFLPKTKTWQILQSEHLPKSSSIQALFTPSGTILVVAHKAENYDFSNGLSIFILNDNNKLDNVQTLKTNPFYEFALWRGTDAIYLMCAIDHILQDNIVNFESNTPIYEWKGNHFDIFHYVTTMNAKKITAFQIGASDFICIANYKNNHGNMHIFSEIFKYDGERGEFVLSQRVATNGAVEVKFFGFEWNSFMEAFIVVINEYPSFDVAKYYTVSIVYKYQNGIFVPFQNLPASNIVRWLPMVGRNGEFLLVGITKQDEIEIFQYNGWLFSKILHNVNVLSQQPGVKSFKQFVFYDNPIFVFSNSINGESTNYFNKPIFKASNPIKDIKNKVYNWCQKIHYSLSCFGEKYFKSESITKNLLKELQNHHSLGHLKTNQLVIDRALIDKIQTKEVHSSDLELDDNIIHNINNIQSSFHSQQLSVKSLNEILSSTFRSTNETFVKSLRINNLELACNSKPCHLNKLLLNKINRKDINLYQNEIVLVESGFQNYREIQIDNLLVKNKMSIERMNNSPLEDIQRLIQMLAEDQGVLVKGTVQFDQGFSFSGQLENIKLNNDIILLKSGDQRFRGNFMIPKVKSAILEVPRINDIELKTLRDTINSENRTISSANLTQLTVDDIFVDNFIDGVNLEDIQSFALRLNGKQDLQGTFEFNNLSANQVVLNKANDDITNKIVKISGGEFEINQDFRFDNLIVKNLSIGKRLNSIQITNSKMDVLLLNSTDEQKIIGEKVFDNVELMGPVKLLGKINSGSLDRINPISLIEEPLTLIGDFIILGNVSIESRIASDNIVNEEKQLSLNDLQQDGLKLSDDLIDIPLSFLQPLEVKSLDSDRVNGIDPLTWISSGDINPKIITGKKMFLQDLAINGNCSISSTINNIDSNFTSDILTVDGDQEITGKIFIQNITTPGLNCDDAILGGRQYTTLLTSSKKYKIPGEIIINKIATVDKSIFSQRTEILGTIDNWNISDIIRDTFFVDDNKIEINHSTNFKALLIVKLSDMDIVSNMSLKEIGSHIDWDRELYLNGPLYLDRMNNVDRIIFELSIYGISKADFGKSWLLSTGDQVLRGRFIFDTISCLSGTLIESQKINDIELPYLYDNVIWINGDAILKNVIYERVMSNGPINIDGYINYAIVPGDFILKDAYLNSPIYVDGYKTIQGNVYVRGQVFALFICNVPMEKFCFMKDSESVPSMTIEGNLHLYYEPYVKMLYGSYVEEMMTNIWFRDSFYTSFNKNHFNKIIFKSNIILEGLMNEHELKSIRNDFVSLYTDQELSNLFKINTIYAKDVIVGKETRIDGYLQGIILDRFNDFTLKTIGYQTFTNDLQLQGASGNIEIYGSVNNLNIARDLMRLGGANVFHGNTIFNSDILAYNIFTKYLQQIDIDYWINYSAKRQGSTISFRGVKTFRAINTGSLRINGYINDRSTNYLLKNGPQVIDGKFTFHSNDLYFKSIVINENIQGINVTAMFNDLVYKSDPRTFMTSPKTITSSMSAKNVMIDGIFNDTNFGEIITSITLPVRYNYYAEEFRKLIDHSKYFNNELVDSCAFINADIEAVQIIKGDILAVTTVKIALEIIEELLVVAIENSNGLPEIHFFKWNMKTAKFVKDQRIESIYLNEAFSKMFSVDLSTKTGLYIETSTVLTENPVQYKNRIHFYVPYEGFTVIQELSNNATSFVTSIVIGKQPCMLTVQPSDMPHLYCLDENQDKFQLRRVISIANSSKVYSLNTSIATYLIAEKLDKIDVYHWSKDDLQKLSMLQTLSNVKTSAFTTWIHEHLLATVYCNQTSIYKFDASLQRFTKTQTIELPMDIDLIGLNSMDRSQLILCILTQELNYSRQLILYEHSGVAGFQYLFTYHMSIPEVNAMTVIAQHNMLTVTISSPSGITVLKSDLKF